MLAKVRSALVHGPRVHALQSMRAAHSPTGVDPQLRKLMAPSDGGVGPSTNSKSSLNALTAVAAAVTAAGFVAGKHNKCPANDS